MERKEKEGKAFVIKEYLQGLFPECLIEMKWDFDSGSLKSRIDDPSGKIKHRVSFTLEFVADNTAHEIPQKLNDRNLKGILEKAGKREVLVTYQKILILSN